MTTTVGLVIVGAAAMMSGLLTLVTDRASLLPIRWWPIAAVTGTLAIVFAVAAALLFFALGLRTLTEMLRPDVVYCPSTH